MRERAKGQEARHDAHRWCWPPATTMAKGRGGNTIRAMGPVVRACHTPAVNQRRMQRNAHVPLLTGLVLRPRPEVPRRNAIDRELRRDLLLNGGCKSSAERLHVAALRQLVALLVHHLHPHHQVAWQIHLLKQMQRPIKSLPGNLLQLLRHNGLQAACNRADPGGSALQVLDRNQPPSHARGSRGAGEAFLNPPFTSAP